MRKGELADCPLPDLLDLLSAGRETGCVHLRTATGDRARVHLRDGLVYAAGGWAGASSLGERLLETGAVSATALAEAEQLGRTELPGWQLGELLVHLELVGRDVVEAQARELLRDDVRLLAGWSDGSWLYRPGERTRQDVAPAVAVEELLDGVPRRSALVVEPEPEPAAIEAAALPDPVRAPSPVLEPLPAPAPAGPPDPQPTAVQDAEALAAAHAELRAVLAEAYGEQPGGAGHPYPPYDDTPDETGVSGTGDPDDGDAGGLSARDISAADGDPQLEDHAQDAYVARSDTDTAALLRELSSLGTEDEHPPGPHPPSGPRPLTPAQLAANRKKKGLFGR